MVQQRAPCDNLPVQRGSQISSLNLLGVSPLGIDAASITSVASWAQNDPVKLLL